MAPARQVRGLHCEDSFRSAAGKVIWTRCEEMMGFADAALEGSDIEGVHDMRVGSRRLRAAVELFADVFPKRQRRVMIREVKRLADALGEVRDLDVMLERLEGDRVGRPVSQQLVIKELIDEMEGQRVEARRQLHQTLEDLERDDFPRRFLAVVAIETM